jgi:glycosyltransferase involved in cell wall biosynthesis
MTGAAGSIDLKTLKVAIVHEWFVDYSGSERVVEQMLNIFPRADLFAQVEFLPDNLRGFIKNKPVKTSFIQKLPRAKTKYRNYLALMPLAVEQFDMSSYDLIISSNHAVAKGILRGPDQIHICYCHSPMRYAWDLTHQYLRQSGLGKGLKGWLARLMLHYIRQWDLRSANNVDEFIANSDFIAQRIWKVYRRQARVINPPVNVEAFPLCFEKSDYYLTASRMVPYKRIDIIIEAFNRMPEKELVVIGDGPDFAGLVKKAGSNIRFLGFQPHETLKNYMQKARAFLFAAEEDFGIIPVEAQACGTPVIAYARGGALETILENETGIFFDHQHPDAIIEAVYRFEKMGKFNYLRIHENALRFSEPRFRKELLNLVLNVLNEYNYPGSRHRSPGAPISDLVDRRQKLLTLKKAFSP